MATTLEVLQNYLTAGIEVEDELGQRHELIGLNRANSKQERKELAEIWPIGIPSWKVVKCAEITPVLRSFEDLCTPLSTGEVPAVTLAKHFGYEVKERDENDPWDNQAELTSDGFICMEGVKGEVLELMPDGVLIVHGKDKNHPTGYYDSHNAANYLRSLHFALAPLIEGTDFIRKEN